MSSLHTPLAAAALALISVNISLPVFAQEKPGPQGKTPDKGIRLANGWMITPAGTQHEVLGDMLLGGALSPDGTRLAFVNGGRADHQVHLVDTRTGKVVQSLPVERAQSTGGLAWSPDGKTLYVAGGNAGKVYVFTRQSDSTLRAEEPWKIAGLRSGVAGEAEKPDPAKDAGRDPAKEAVTQDAYLAGLTAAPDGKTLYLANLGGDSIFALEGEEAGKVRASRKLGEGDRPGVVRLSPDGKTLYVALWAKGTVLALDPTTLETKATLTAGNHPNDLLLSRDGKRLFVSCGNDDMVTVLDPVTGQTTERIVLKLTPKAPAGATPSALALSPDGKKLFVADSDNNAVAVVDVEEPGRSHVKGFIPTAHYPTMVTVSRDGTRLFIGSGKGLGTGPNPVETLPADTVSPKGFPYIASLLKGVLSTVLLPDENRLAAYTKQVYKNTPYTSDTLLTTPNRAPKPGSSPIPSRVGDKSPIKYVLYIIKENRTYDQVFGDFKDKNGKPRGMGDPNLCLFGEDVTPNHHKLAREYVLLDNLYANGEVSVDGHHWSNGAYVPDFMQRTWPSQYGGKGTPPLTPELSATPAGRLWDLCARAKVPYRTYYYHTKDNQSAEWAAARRKGVRDYLAVDIFIKELAGFEKTGEMPNFMIMALSEDHTKGTRPGVPTPKAAVASNDVGIGKIVEACSKSRFWKEMAIFIIEDDAQNGPDHIDAHRTVALAVSPYTRRGGKVDSTFYSTVSLLRTMELILGLPPMSQYDAAATPLYAAFTDKPDFTPYTAAPAKIDLNAVNSRTAYGANTSLALNFTAPDMLTVADEDALNRVLWHSIKGAKTPYPALVRRPLFHGTGHPLASGDADDEEEKEDDDKPKVKGKVAVKKATPAKTAKKVRRDED